MQEKNSSNNRVILYIAYEAGPLQLFGNYCFNVDHYISMVFWGSAEQRDAIYICIQIYII